MTAPLVRLADRIRAASENTAAIDPILLTQGDVRITAPLFQRIHRALHAGVPVIVGDNIAEYYYCGTDQEDFDVLTDFPCQIPPFQQFWIEWTQPSAVRSRVHPDASVELSSFPFCGCLVTVWDGDTTMPDEWMGLRRWQSNIMSNINPDYEHLSNFEKQWAKFREGARWIFQFSPVGMLRDFFVVPPGSFWFSADENGRVINYVVISHGHREHTQLLGFEAPLFTHPALMTMTFLNIKNGTITPAAQHAPDKFVKNYARKNDLPLVRYHTVIVDPSRTSKPSLPGPGTDRKMPVHLVRGHLVTYGGQHGLLFGKYSGTFFRPPHVRGNKGEGVSLHDYAVKAPKGVRDVDAVRTTS